MNKLNREQECLFEFHCIIIDDLLQQFPHTEHSSEAPLNRSSRSQVFLKISQHSHENTCVGVPFL